MNRTTCSARLHSVSVEFDGDTEVMMTVTSSPDFMLLSAVPFFSTITTFGVFGQQGL